MSDMNDLPTIDQAEDAAANALARLIWHGLDPRDLVAMPTRLPGVCRELLRGPLAEDYSRRPGGYCMRSPRDPTLRAIGRFGARVVELSYTSRDPARARLEVVEMWNEALGPEEE